MRCFVNDNNEWIKYDGSQLTSLWAFRNFNIQGDSIVAFFGECEVDLDHMVDVADVINHDTIYSEEMVHFIIEHFELDLEKTIMRQRLLICLIKEIISEKKGLQLIRTGDDLYYNNKKLSVSIATLTRVSTMIHVGINISSDNTPIPTISLNELEVKKVEFAEEVVKKYSTEIDNITLARCKVRGVD